MKHKFGIIPTPLKQLPKPLILTILQIDPMHTVRNPKIANFGESQNPRFDNFGFCGIDITILDVQKETLQIGTLCYDESDLGVGLYGHVIKCLQKPIVAVALEEKQREETHAQPAEHRSLDAALVGLLHFLSFDRQRHAFYT